MKAIILNHQAGAIDALTIPQEIECQYEDEQDTEVVYEYLINELNYEPFVQFMLLDECPIYDDSQEEPIYVIR